VKLASRSFGEESGAGSIEVSQKGSRLKRGATDSGAVRFFDAVNRDRVSVKQVEGKTFYLQGSRWVDAALTGKDSVTSSKSRHVKYFSDEYFALLAAETGIGKLLSIGREVTFRWGGEVIAIDA
jgi:hypothetical protein